MPIEKLPEELLRQFPTRRIKAFDGMAVTASVWDEAHDYHRLQQRFHALLAHGPGIITGLEVIASDPPDSSVNIMPGIAVDHQGQTIVIPKPIAYNLAQSVGPMQVRLTYSESRPTPGPDGDGPQGIFSQFEIAAGPARSGAPGVELARVRRTARDAVLSNAKNSAQPGNNEIDLRFRDETGVARGEALAAAMVHVGTGEKGAPGHAGGVALLAGQLARTAQVRICVDHDVPLAASLAGYGLVMLVGLSAFQLNRTELGALYDYIKAGGTVFMESCRRSAAGREAPADAGFLELMSSMGLQAKEIERGHEVFRDPFLFAAPPPGYETTIPPAIMGAEGAFFSYADYGCIWQGDRRTGPAARDEIRSAIEWGANLASYALARQHRAAPKR